MKKTLIALFFFSGMFVRLSPVHAQQMDNKLMRVILEEKSMEMEGEVGNWQVVFADRLLFVITDETNNRMRIFTPVIEMEEMEGGQMKRMLEANFHSALDAKYSIYNDFVISVFTHPLKELTEPQFVDALMQVVNLANTFGTTYSSTTFSFGNPESEEEEKKLNQKPAKKS